MSIDIPTLSERLANLEDSGSEAIRALFKAVETIESKERSDYSNHKLDTFHLIAAFWDQYLFEVYKKQTRSLTAQDVANLMVLFKLARILNGVNIEDSYNDMISYAALAFEQYKS